MRPIHPFPARMAASIPWEELQREDGPPLRVLDPMAGSGTTVVVARKLGHHAIGLDTDPLAVLLASTWCRDAAPETARAEARRLLEAARVEAKGMRVRDAYPAGADAETRAFIRYWFDGRNRRELTALARGVAGVADVAIRQVLWCAFSRLIITKQASAALALDVAHSRPHKVLTARGPIRPFEHFLDAVEKVLAALPFTAPAEAHPPAKVHEADARRMPLDDASVDIVITSPPYLNAIDYLRGHKFSLVWMGHQVGALRGLRATNVGTEVGLRGKAHDEARAKVLGKMGRVRDLPTRHQGMLARFVDDMDRVLGEVSRVLVPGGRALLVVGDTTLKGIYVRNSQALIALGERHRMKMVKQRRRRLPPNRRYLPPPSSSRSGQELQGRLRSEVILTLEKPSLHQESLTGRGVDRDHQRAGEAAE